MQEHCTLNISGVTFEKHILGRLTRLQVLNSDTKETTSARRRHVYLSMMVLDIIFKELISSERRHLLLSHIYFCTFIKIRTI